MADDVLAPHAAREAAQVRRLADALIAAAVESIEGQRSADGVLLDAFACALGRLIGDFARRSKGSLVAVAAGVIAQVRRVAIREYRRPSFAI